MKIMTNILNEIEKKALTFIRNEIMHGERKPSLRNLMTHLGYKSPRSASLIISALIEKGVISRDDATKEIRVNYFKNIKSKLANIPLAGAITCGQPILAVQNIEAYIPYEVKDDPKEYFFLRAFGDSMDKVGIDDGDLVLVKKLQQPEQGDKVVALIGNEATIKIFKQDKEKVILEPRSSNPTHKPIYIFEDLQIQGKVVDVIKIKN
jgi:repressor LexA